MGNSNKRTSGITATLYILIFFSPPIIFSAEPIPTAADINALAEKAKLTIGKFMRESISLRIGFEYSGKFLWQKDREKLYQLAKSASDNLQAIADSQRKSKSQIDDYEGYDWDNIFGMTGLWRKLSTDLYTTNLNKCELDFYAALCAEQPAGNNAFREILARLKSLKQIHDTAYLQFLKARILARLARTDPTHKPLTKRQFDELMERSDMKHTTVFKIEIARIKLLGLTGPNQLMKLADDIAKSNSANDYELILSLACLQRLLGQTEAFEKTVLAQPKTEYILGQLALSDMSYQLEHGQLNLQKYSLFEAELAARAAWRNNPQKYKTLLEDLTGRKTFQTPLILYVAAAATAEESPTKAVNLLIEASNLQSSQQSSRPDFKDGQIAEQAVWLAYNLFLRDNSYCELALKAFDNYSFKAGKKNIDDELEYLYGTVLINCRQREKGIELLQKIAGSKTHTRRNRAKLDLIEHQIEQKRYQNQPPSRELLIKLSFFFRECTGEGEESKELRRRAITLYCRALLETNETTSAQKVLDTVTEAEIENDPNLYFFKAGALRQMGRLNESAEILAKICHKNDASYVLEAEQLLMQIIENIEEQQEKAGFAKLMTNSRTIARYCLKISQSTYGLIPISRARLYLAELLLLSSPKNGEKLLQAEKLLGQMPAEGIERNVDFLRCRARLLSEQGKYEQATSLWTKVAQIRKNQAQSSNTHTWQWWRAKFYELDCYIQAPKANKKSVLHAIEVLENSYSDLPTLWAEKLNLLKQQCR